MKKKKVWQHLETIRDAPRKEKKKSNANANASQQQLSYHTEHAGEKILSVAPIFC